MEMRSRNVFDYDVSACAPARVMCVPDVLKAGGKKTNAVTEVFDLPELVENILLYVDPKALFKLQRVNQAFNSITNRSKPI